MNAVYRREMRAYFAVPSGYVFLAIFLFISGYFFFTGNLATGSPDIRSFFTNLISVLVFLIPMLTMRLLAEEKKMKTDQLLLSAPVSLGGIVMGKYLAAMSLFGIGLGVTLLYPLCLLIFGHFDPLALVGNYIGISVLVGAFVAIGLFISALTENQIVAAVLSYCSLFALLFIGWMGDIVQSVFWAQIFSWLSVLDSYNSFTLGVFNPAAIIYYLSLIGLFLFLTVCVLERRRWA